MSCYHLHFIGLLLTLYHSAGYSTALPYQSPQKHLGVASCSSSVCHGSVRTNDKSPVLLNEYITWSHHDAHASAFKVLLSKESAAMAAKLGLPKASDAPLCLRCHADYVPENQRGEKFQLSDGVGCEACHAGAENWIKSHTAKHSSYRDNVARGMFPTANMRQRARLCISCHVGNQDKFASHRIMGAGHPRLSFELDTFQALQPPHFKEDEDYRQRKVTVSHTKRWAIGQLAVAAGQLALLQGPMISQPHLFPELALFNCHACHNNSLHQLDWRRRNATVYADPGSVPLADGHLRMAWLIARQIDQNDAGKILGLMRRLHSSSNQSRKKIVHTSRQLQVVVNDLQKKLTDKTFSDAEKKAILTDLIAKGVKGEYRDYIGAEQAVMAIELLIIDLGLEDRLKSHTDVLYKRVEQDELFRPAQFIAALRQLRKAVDQNM